MMTLISAARFGPDFHVALSSAYRDHMPPLLGSSLLFTVIMNNNVPRKVTSHWSCVIDNGLTSYRLKAYERQMSTMPMLQYSMAPFAYIASKT